MNYKIALLKGDGIGPEIVDSATQILSRVGEIYGHTFEYTEYLAGGIALDTVGIPLPEETVLGCKNSDSVILGAVGGPKWDTLHGHLRPEKALLGIRSALGLYTNLRPSVLFEELLDACPLKNTIVNRGFDIMIVRELTGGLYFGKSGRDNDTAYDTEEYSVTEIERICRAAFEIAGKRNKRVTSIDKANVMESSRLWREVAERVASEYPDIEFSNMLVDNAAMQLIKNPYQFDVIVTSNIFGDILSDELSQITGSIGMQASASIGNGTLGMYEPIHGSAPDIAGKGVANPLATILSVALMLDHSFDLKEESRAIESSVQKVLARGDRTADILGSSDKKPLSTSEMTAAVLSFL